MKYHCRKCGHDWERMECPECNADYGIESAIEGAENRITELEADVERRRREVEKRNADKQRLQTIIKELEGERDKLEGRVNMLQQERAGNVWCWQGDGNDKLETLTCPVLIRPESLRALLSALPVVIPQGCRVVLEADRPLPAAELERVRDEWDSLMGGKSKAVILTELRVAGVVQPEEDADA